MMKLIVIAEDDCDGHIYEFETQAEADAFSSGVSTAAGMYGAGWCAAVGLKDLEDLDPNNKHEKQVIEYINTYLVDK